MSSSEEILVSHDAAVATITLNRPDQLNSLTLPMLEAFSSALTGAVASGARAIVISGIATLVTYPPPLDDPVWGASFPRSRIILEEGGVNLVFLEPKS